MALTASEGSRCAAGGDTDGAVSRRLYAGWGAAEEPAAYLRVAIVNGCRSYHRRRRTEADRLPALMPCAGEGVPAGELDDIVAALPARQRTVVRLRYWSDLSEVEIADVLGCAPGTVKSLASRAKHRLATALS